MWKPFEFKQTETLFGNRIFVIRESETAVPSGKWWPVAMVGRLYVVTTSRDIHPQ